MLKAEEMTKLRVLCQKQNIKAVINELYRAKAIDIIEHTKNENLDIGNPLENNSEISDAAVKARSLIYKLKIENEVKVKESDFDNVLEDVKFIQKINEEVSKLNDELKVLKTSIKSYNEDLDKLEILKKLDVDINLLHESKIIKYFIGYIDDISGFKNDLKNKIKKDYELFSCINKSKNLVCIFVVKEKEWDLLNILKNHSFNELKINYELIEKKISIENLKSKLEIENSKKEHIEKKINDIKKKHSKDILKKEKVLTITAKKNEAPLNFAETKNFSIITGWVPSIKLKELKKNIETITKNNVSIETLEIKKEDSPPILLNNPLFAKPYEFLIRLFSMPSYKEIDPVLFMFITFPLFFGFMLGDMGYGVVTLILFLILMKKIPSAKPLLTIMIFCSISSIIFGGIYAEAFGFEVMEFFEDKEYIENDHGHHEPHGFLEWVTTWPLHRNADNALNLIILTAIIGFIHVNFGLLLGFINVFRNHGFKHALFEKGSWFLLQFAVLLIVLSAMNILIPEILWFGLFLILVSAIMLFLGEGIQGLVELPSIFVHIGSYMRLMAIGLASVGLAVVVNEQTMPMFGMGIIGIVVGILLFTIGHTINIALGIIGPFLHSLRLHYVEYFTKFYKGGGKEFTPFGAED
jgi:V/A-type H+/Na+-transporting ATPase subunit I